jgi:hypothetical protein
MKKSGKVQKLNDGDIDRWQVLLMYLGASGLNKYLRMAFLFALLPINLVIHEEVVVHLH